MANLESLRTDIGTGIKLIRSTSGLGDISDQITTMWAETTVDGLIRRFAKTLWNRFSVSNLSFFSLVLRGNVTKAIAVDILDHSIDSFGAPIVTSLESFLADHSQAEFGRLLKMNFAGSDISVCRLGDSHQQFALVFTTAAGPSTEVLSLMAMQLQNEIRWHQRLATTLERANRDDLTGLYNCAYFEQAIAKEILRADRYKSSFCVLFLDIDNFKQVNDTYGHLVGSDLLRQLARIIRDVLREVDIVARFGGDEFVAVLIGTDKDCGCQIAERLRERISRTEFDATPGTRCQITVSIGISTYGADGKSKEELLQAADMSMYDSKHRGKNRVTCAGPLPVARDLLNKDEK